MVSSAELTSYMPLFYGYPEAAAGGRKCERVYLTQSPTFEPRRSVGDDTAGTPSDHKPGNGPVRRFQKACRVADASKIGWRLSLKLKVSSEPSVPSASYVRSE